MASKKDLVEAHAFSRRRLVSAFLSGAPGGREVEPARPGRTVFGGAVMAVLLIAGGAVAHFLHPAAATDWWKQNGLVVTKGGARYVVVGPDNKKELHPVVNLTSAQLMLGLDLESKSKVIDQSDISERHPQNTLGIFNAPEQLPTKDAFINSGWTACTADGKGTYADISADPDITPAKTDGFLAETSKSTYLITEGPSKSGQPQAYSYDLGTASTYVNSFFEGQAPPTIRVPQSWVNLFPKGTEIGLDAFGVPDAGQPYQGKDASPGTMIGSVTNSNAQNFLLTDKGWAYMTEFQSSVYQVAASAAGHPAQTAQATGPVSATASLPPTTWPRNKPNPASGPACAELVTKGSTSVRLGKSPGSRAWPAGKEPEVDAAPTAGIDAGRGAFVYAGTGVDPASADPFIIDATGHTNKLDGPKTVETLGLTTKSGPVVPASWLLLFPNGPALSTEMALCPPSTSKVEGDRCATSE